MIMINKAFHVTKNVLFSMKFCMTAEVSKILSRFASKLTTLGWVMKHKKAPPPF